MTELLEMNNLKHFNDQAAEKARKKPYFCMELRASFAALEMMAPGLHSDLDPEVPLPQTAIEMSGIVPKTTGVLEETSHQRQLPGAHHYNRAERRQVPI